MTERPAYAKDWPADDELDALVSAFEAGNYRAVREGATRVASSDKPDAVKAAARDLKSRTEASRAQIALLVIAAAHVIALSGYEIATHGPSAPHPPPRPTIERIH